MREIERFGEGGNIEIRSDEGKSVITGYAATFNTESHDLGGFREVIRPGAFDRSLREKADVIARANHRSESLLGRTSSGTLRLSVDDRGLKYEVDVPDTTAGRDTLEYIKRGDIRESSFAFMTPRNGAKWDKRSSDGLGLRELVDVDLIDVSPVADQAAYPSTQVSARTLEEAKAATKPTPDSERDEQALRQRAIGRLLAVEKREQSYEDLLQAIYRALVVLLGSPWESDTSWWAIEATFTGQVIVERFDGARRLWLYPMTVTDGTPTFGEPVRVEEQYVPVVIDSGARSIPHELNTARHRLAAQ